MQLQKGYGIDCGNKPDLKNIPHKETEAFISRPGNAINGLG